MVDFLLIYRDVLGLKQKFRSRDSYSLTLFFSVSMIESNSAARLT